MLEYEVRGGFAPRAERLIVHRNRRATLRTGRQATAEHFLVPHADFEALRHALAAAHFESLQSEYVGRLIDVPTVRITYEGRTVVVRAGARVRQLQPALRNVGAIIAQHTKG